MVCCATSLSFAFHDDGRTSSVGRRSLHRIDDEDFDGPSVWFKLQAELFLKRAENGWRIASNAARHTFSRKAQLHVERASYFGAIDNHSVNHACQCAGQIRE